MKTIEDSFSDWEGSAFGFGYGTGEPHIIPALVTFFSHCKHFNGSAYDYREIEADLGPPVAWLLINILCRQDVIEYGSSPRWGWLTPHGIRLRDFVASKSIDDLLALTRRDQNYEVCYPDACNCGPNGYEAGRVCENPLWRDRKPQR